MLADTKGVITSRKSKDRQYNDQKKKYKRTNKDLQNITHKTKDRVKLEYQTFVLNKNNLLLFRQNTHLQK